MSNRTRETRSKFLRLTFQNYYLSNKDKVDEPHKIHTREFAIEDWEYTWRCPQRVEIDSSGNEQRIGCGSTGAAFSKPSSCPVCDSTEIQVTNWIRHIGFRTQEALLNELVENAPHSIYHSAAFYDIPVARLMSEKGWQGAELVFDIDADHLSSSCAIEHDSWRCNDPDCLESGKGPSPSTGCPKCGGLSFSSRKWLCDTCLEDAKKNTIKVHDEFLVNDFGIDPENIQLNYSGHRGYHLRVRDPRVFKLDSSARVEIVQYITGMGFRISPAKDDSPRDRHRVLIVSKGVPLPTEDQPQFDVPGWGNRVSEAIIEFIRNIDSYEGEERWVRPLRANKEAALKGLLRSPPILSARVKGIGDKFWQEIAIKAVEAFGGNIDVPVTHDIHRVIRLAGSLNGKTGFSVTPLTRDEMDNFDPFNDSLIAANGSMKVRFDGVLPVPQIRIANDTYGPFHKETVELPMSVAVFMLCKGVATIE
ncbi:MAG: DNA primase small subunit domain-containing protein [Candidatus Thorarchaeota archaeon]